MVSRNRYGRFEVEARDAADSPWSDDQATTSYFAGHLRAVAGGVPGVPPLPERFAEAEPADDGGFDDEPTQWHDELVSWDVTPPRASGVARRLQPSAAERPRAGMVAYASELEEPEDWTAELEAQLQAAAPVPAPLELEPVTEVAAQDPYAWEPTTAYAPAELEEENPWEEAAELSPLYAADLGAGEVARLPAARTQRQLPQRAAAPVQPSLARASSPEPGGAPVPAARTQRRRAAAAPRAQTPPQEPTAYLQPVPAARTQRQRPVSPASSPRVQPMAAAATGPRRAVTSRTELPAVPQATAAARRVEDTRALSRSAQPTQRHRPAAMHLPAPELALEDNPFAKRRGARGSWLLSSVVSCGAVAALYFSGSMDRLSGMLHRDQAPVLRSAALPTAAPLEPTPPMAAEPAAPEAPVAAPAEPAREPAAHARGGSWRKRGSADDDLGSAPRKRAPAADELASTDEPAQREPRADVSPDDPPAQLEAPGALATLRINSRPWSQVFVDGKLVGNTPQLALHVSPGHHDIRLANPELEVSKTFKLDARPGETVSRVELLTD